MAVRRSLNQTRKELNNKIEKAGEYWIEKFPAEIGNYSGVVEVPDSESMIYVRLTTGQVLKVFNNVAPNIFDWKVYVGRDKTNPGLLKVLESRWVYNIAQTIAYVLFHHSQHEYPQPDTVWIRRDQILPLLVLPNGGFNIRLFGDVVYQIGMDAPIRIEDQDIDLSAYEAVSGAHYVLLEVDGTTGTINYVVGDDYANVEALRLVPLPTPTVGNFPICGIEFYEGQTEIRRDSEERNIVDLRMFTSGASGGASTLDALTDVDTTGVADGDALVYDLASTTWVPGAAASGPSTLDDLTDVNTTGVADGQGLVYDADTSTWVPGSVDVAHEIHAFIPGVLAVTTDAHPRILVTKDIIVASVYIYAVGQGSAGNTIIDVNKNGTTIFTTQANRPTLAYNDADGYAVSGTPEVQGFTIGDIMEFDLDSVATGATDLTIVVNCTVSAPLPSTAPMRMFSFAIEGTAGVRTGNARMYNNFDGNFTISKVFVTANSAPTGSALIVDIHKNGTTIFTTQANRPQVTAGTNTGVSTSIDVTAFNNGDYLTMDVDAVGSTTPGSDIIVNVFFS